MSRLLKGALTTLAGWLMLVASCIIAILSQSIWHPDPYVSAQGMGTTIGVALGAILMIVGIIWIGSSW